ncbi:MAG: tetratricopeptide repeat protein [Anaerolineae bacterium]|nr:tetratricopeptide repeat protein [Anaerolineae bacterium]
MMIKLSNRVIITLIVWLTIGFGLVACQSDEATPTPEPLATLLDQARDLADDQQYNEAVAVLEAAAENYPTAAGPLIQAGQIYLRQQQLLPAEDAFNRALARDLENPLATAGLAETILRQGNTLQALSLWKEAATLDPELPGIYSGLGRVYLARLEFDEAEEAFSEQLTHQADAEATWYLAALSAPVDEEAARAYLAELPTDMPDHLAAQYDYLTATLDTAENGSPDERAQAIGIAMVQIEAWPLAIYALQIAADDDTASDAAKSETLAFLGHALAQYGRPALDMFRQAEVLDGSSALPAYFQGIYLRQQKAFGVAEDMLLRAANLDENNPAPFVELAKLKTEQGFLSDAEAYYMKAVEVAPEDIDLQLLQANFYAGRSYRLEEAGIPLAEALVGIDEDNAEALDLLGWMQFLTGHLEDAESNLSRAVELDPQFMRARFHLARFFEAQGQLTDAYKAYQAITEQDLTGNYRAAAWEGIYRIEGQLDEAEK